MTLTAVGLTIPRLADLRQSMRDAVASELGPEWLTDNESILGKIIDIIAGQLEPAYELIQLVYDSISPDSGEGTQLDRLCSIVGIVREPETQSTGSAQLTGTVGVPVPSGSLVRVPNGGAIFETLEDVLLASPFVEVAIQAVEAGPIEGAAGTITEIVTAIAGWTSVSNAGDVTPGRSRETDADLRARRERSLVAPSASTDYGIASALQALTSVDYARVISDRDAHTLRALVYPATADVEAVARTLWNTCPAGIEQLGGQTNTVVDAQGIEQDVSWDWVAEVTPAVTVDIEGSTDTAELRQAIRDAVKAEVAILGVGEDVHAVQLQAAVVTALGQSVTYCLVELGGYDSFSVDIDETAVVEDGDISITVA